MIDKPLSAHSASHSFALAHSRLQSLLPLHNLRDTLTRHPYQLRTVLRNIEAELDDDRVGTLALAPYVLAAGDEFYSAGLRASELYFTLTADVVNAKLAVGLFDDALEHIDQAIRINNRTNIDRHAFFQLLRCKVLWAKGKPADVHQGLSEIPAAWSEALKVIEQLALRPYLIGDRTLRADVARTYSEYLLATGQQPAGVAALFRSLGVFDRPAASHEALLARIQQLFRRKGLLSVLRYRGLNLKHKGDFYFQSLLFGVSKLLPNRRLADIWCSAAIRSLRLLRQKRGFAAARIRHRNAPIRNGTIITRAQGGIGDILMMLGAISELRERCTNAEPIVFCVSAKYLALAEHLAGVQTCPIENMDQTVEDYGRWIDLSACPAAFVEGRSAPRVRMPRIEIFARAILGDKGKRLRPWYCVTAPELNTALSQRIEWGVGIGGRVVIGIQLRSADNYKDYPYMRPLIDILAELYDVLVFADRSKPPDDLPPSVRYVCDLPLRAAFALAATCNVLVCPDSAFVHLAEALEVPCVALFGPTDGAVFTKHYRSVFFMDARQSFHCLPCWRNQFSDCETSGHHDSACLRALAPLDVAKRVRGLVDASVQSHSARVRHLTEAWQRTPPSLPHAARQG